MAQDAARSLFRRSPMHRSKFAPLLCSVVLLALPGCSGECSDDGLFQDPPANCAAAASSETEGPDTEGPDTEGPTSGSSTPGTTDPGSESSGAASQCENGVRDADEADVDCGGSCPSGCVDGQACGRDEDCESQICGEDGQCIAAGCENEVRDGDETDVDCGGSCPAGCGASQGCDIDGDCASGRCDRGSCGMPPSCDDGVLNGDESDVDCGGSCTPCANGEDCTAPTDCASATCDPKAEVCVAPSCTDGVLNGDETDIDCGGACGPSCGAGDSCTDGYDCAQLVCDAGTCAPPTCDDGARNGDETDVDCGGPSCAPCDAPGSCETPADCASGLCDGGMCVDAACADETLNGSETDVDCGGPDCAPCDDAQACAEPADCASGVCAASSTCESPTCDDGVRNGAETDIDCGGSTCEACENNATCAIDSDCESASCASTEGVCEATTCSNGAQDGDETDIDCGGPDCAPCDTAELCDTADDCSSQVCIEMSGTCAAPLCGDGLTNGDESDTDCGGPDCDACPSSSACVFAADCASSVCLGGTCQPGSCDDLILNGSETDLDCGGPDCAPCGDGLSCSEPSDCSSGVCEGAVCSAPDCDDGVRNGEETDVDCGGTVCAPCTPGQACVLGSDCSTGGCDEDSGTCNAPLSVTVSPACADAADGSVELNASGAGGTGGPYTYAWTPDDGSLDDPSSATPTATASGVTSYSVTVDDGLTQAMETATVVDNRSVDLESNCTLFTADFLGPPNATASVTYDAESTRACVQDSSDFGLHLCADVHAESQRLTATLEVLDDEDDNDWIGLVWGAQDSSNYYSMVWKQFSQNLLGCAAPSGILVKRIEAPSFEALAGPDFFCPEDTPNSALLVTPATSTTDGWEPGQSYSVSIEHTPTQSDVEVIRDSDGAVIAEFSIVDSTFPTGGFGSTTLSQANACVGPVVRSCL